MTQYWRSLEELAGDPEFLERAAREFPPGAADPPEGVTRRQLLQLVGASLSLAGLGACRRPLEKIVPYTDAPENLIPGVPLRYATAMPLGVGALGLVVESHEGRPTKIEGNELHPSTLGASSAWAQAAIYDLYDPDRSSAFLYSRERTEWTRFVETWKKLHGALSASQGEGLAVLSEPFSSPTRARISDRFRARFPKARWATYAPLGDESVYAGIRAATGDAYEPVYFFDRAKVILSLDSDFLFHDRDAVRHALGFSEGRRKADGMNRLYAAESSVTITGIAADHRLRLQSGRMAALTAALGAEITGSGKAPESKDIDRKWVQAVARDLKAHAGSSLIVAGAGQPAAVHAAVVALNAALGNVGKTISFVAPKETERSSSGDLKRLTADMEAGKVTTLVILGGNPVYDAPADFGFAGALAKVKNRIRLGFHVDETSAACDWHLPEAHFLESWGDVRSVGGPLAVVQPLIEPLFGGKSPIELLSFLAEGEEKTGHELVRATWQTILPATAFEKSWERVLHDGLLKGSELPTASPSVGAKPIADLLQGALAKTPPATAESLEIVLRPSAAVGDGRFANVAWMQEVPDPVTKLTWDNAALVAPETARELGLSSGDLVRIEYAKKRLEIPVFVVPGHAEHSVAIDLGYGRTAAGRIGNGVGFDVYPLRSSEAPGFGAGAKLERTGTKHVLATAQDHWSAEGRDLVRESSVAEFHEDGHDDHAHSHVPIESLWDEEKEHPYVKPPQWGMTIDLGSCIGCNACVLACQSENNIPVVGKDQVTRGREMHWIRVDRYFAGSAEAPESIVFQPLPCMHCENAPCEQVCPVAATVHDEHGLNTMVYNRCIGTRYCSNNCPYKVRRFNFYNFTRDTPELLKMAQNPDVTVRARGVMEKCSYCIQRLNRSRIDAKIAGREPKDGDVQTACQQSCPTRAIQFGDILDEKSVVAGLKRSKRNYDLLGELNTKPRTSYLLRLRNPNPELRQA